MRRTVSVLALSLALSLPIAAFAQGGPSAPGPTGGKEAAPSTAQPAPADKSREKISPRPDADSHSNSGNAGGSGLMSTGSNISTAPSGASSEPDAKPK
jgi:hypothetical protein